MFAETVHTIYMSLPDQERQRFIGMLQQELQQVDKPKKVKKSTPVKSKDEYIDIALRAMSSRKRKH